MLVLASEDPTSVQFTMVPLRISGTSVTDKTDTSDTDDPFMSTECEKSNVTIFNTSGSTTAWLAEISLVLYGTPVKGKLCDAVIFHWMKLLSVLQVMASSPPGHTLATPEGDTINLDSVNKANDH